MHSSIARLSIVSIISLVCTPAIATGMADPDLLGCWRAEKGIQHFSDGTSRSGALNCAFEIQAERMISVCKNGGAVSRIVTSYQVTSPGKFTSETISHNLVPGLVGMRREIEYRVETDRLILNSKPVTMPNAPRPAPIRFESISVRDDAQQAVARNAGGPHKCEPQAKP